MSLCVVIYPEMSPGDREWIQAIRRSHDALFFDVVAPHVTVVFPTEHVEESRLIPHVSGVAIGFAPFEVVFRCAILGDPGFRDHAHAFLVPDEGFSDIVRLHDALYTGLLRSALRLDLPFVPHIGVASMPNLRECQVIVDRLNGEPFEVRTRVEALDVIGYDGRKTWTIERCPLKGRDV